MVLLVAPTGGGYNMENSDLTTGESSPEELIGQLPSLAQDVQLGRVLELLSAAGKRTERLEQLTCLAWEYLIQHELWKAGSMSLEEVKAVINWPAVFERIAKHRRTQKRKDRELEGIRQQWGCQPQETFLEEMWPRYLSANLLQHLHRLSKVCPLERAQSLLSDMLLQRLQGSGGFKAPHVQAGDVLRAIGKVQTAEKTVKGGTTGKGASQLLDLRQDPVDDDNEDEEEEEGEGGEEGGEEGD